MRPPGARAPASAASSLVCRSASIRTSSGVRRRAQVRPSRDAPSPEHGASSRMASTGRARGRRARVAADDLGRLGAVADDAPRAARRSAADPARRTAAVAPAAPSSSARWPDLPPGAAHPSSTRMPGSGPRGRRCDARLIGTASPVLPRRGAMSTGPSSTIADGTITSWWRRRRRRATRPRPVHGRRAERGAPPRPARCRCPSGRGPPCRRRDPTRVGDPVGIGPPQRGIGGASRRAAPRSGRRPLRATRRRIAFTRPAAPGRRASRTRSTDVATAACGGTPSV